MSQLKYATRRTVFLHNTWHSSQDLSSEVINLSLMKKVNMLLQYNLGTLLFLSMRRTTSNEIRSFLSHRKLKRSWKRKKVTGIPHYVSSFPEMLRSWFLLAESCDILGLCSSLPSRFSLQAMLHSRLISIRSLIFFFGEVQTTLRVGDIAQKQETEKYKKTGREGDKNRWSCLLCRYILCFMGRKLYEA